ncbi:dihydroorotase [Leptolyngbya sp. FACHB-541]|uniref:dihydroorotase n=1 Tax=Leptolyngbya sp. FACHB-541 TaxID=2692810 RepID=UPI001687D8D7|nr:dihydroorotase [Leptolyngbya sp. FACHB-541]MBD2001396.1 dihydroorotase [Leptolyngbya sp. FACHB-541]
MAELFRQVRLLDPVSDSDRVADVLVADGVIQQVEAQIADLLEDVEICDRPNLILAPGLVDLYSHSGEPGYESRETLDSLMQSALAGGFTRLALLPDTDPAIDNPAGVERMRSLLRLAGPIPQVDFWGALTTQVKGEQMTELAELAAAGAIGFADGRPLQNWALVRRLLEYCQPLGKPIAFSCCDRQLAGNGVVREGLESMQLGLPGSPAIAETIALAALLECVETIGTPVHIMRVSTARSVELIRAAKSRGLPITASTTWMHLLLNTSDVQSYDPSLRLEPPLGNSPDQAALVQGLEEGVLDAIAIDHTPYTYEEKTVSFAEAPPGAIGLELALPLLWQKFVETGNWEGRSLWRYLSTNPALCLGQTPAQLQPGQVAELTLFDPHHRWQITPQALKSLSTNTPWLGREVTGRILRTYPGR